MSITSKIGKMLADVAPGIGAAIGGPVGGIIGAGAKKLLKGALGLPDAASDEETLDALQNASPEQWAAVKQAELDLEKERMKFEKDIVKIHQKDRESARAREIATGDKTPQILAAVITVGFFITLALLFTHGAGLQGTARDAVMLLLGTLGSAFIKVLHYYFGSSTGSKQKDIAMMNHQK